MPYIYAQFHGLNINVFPRIVKGQDVKYLGERESHIDIARKTILLRHAVEQSYELRDTTANTLHIFMLPEFYWRAESGYYPDLFGGKDVTEYISDEAKYFLGKEKYKDWVFVLGTCISGSPDGILTDITGKTREKYLIRNTAIVIGGGPAGRMHRMTKKKMSHIDFADYMDSSGNRRKGMKTSFSTTGNAKDAVFSASLDGKAGIVTHRQSSRDSTIISDKIKGGRTIDKAVRQGLFFEEKGILFTLEICLDHAEARALNTMNDYAALPVATHPYYSQIHLIPSAGMSIMKEHIPLSSKPQSSCLAFNNDGKYHALKKGPSDPDWYGAINLGNGSYYYPPIYASLIDDNGSNRNETEIAVYSFREINISKHNVVLENFIKDARCLSQGLLSVIDDANDDLKNFAMKKICKSIALSLSMVELKRWLWKFFILSLINRKSSFISSRRLTATLQRIRAELNKNKDFRDALSKCGLTRVMASNGNLTDENLREDIKVLSNGFGQVISGPLIENKWWNIAVDGLSLDQMDNTSSSKLARTSSTSDDGISEQRKNDRNEVVKRINEETADRHNDQVNTISDIPIFKKPLASSKGYFVVALKITEIPLMMPR